MLEIILTIALFVFFFSGWQIIAASVALVAKAIDKSPFSVNHGIPMLINSIAATYIAWYILVGGWTL